MGVQGNITKTIESKINVISHLKRMEGGRIPKDVAE